MSAAATPLATIVRQGKHWFCVFKYKVQAYLGDTDFPLVHCISTILVNFICRWHIKRRWCFCCDIFEPLRLSVLSTQHMPPLLFLSSCQDNKRMKRTLEEEQRARKELERIVRRVLKNMNDPSWDETNLWDQCVSDRSKRDQTNLRDVVQSVWTEAANSSFILFWQWVDLHAKPNAGPSRGAIPANSHAVRPVSW